MDQDKAQKKEEEERDSGKCEESSGGAKLKMSPSPASYISRLSDSRSRRHGNDGNEKNPER